jgi:uncharacterized protein
VTGQPIFTRPSETFLETGKIEAGEQYSSYHEYFFKLRKIKDRLHTPAAQEIAAARHDFMAEFFDRLQAEYAGEL